MNTESRHSNLFRKAGAIGLSAALLMGALAVSHNPPLADASSHREAPLISQDQVADATDVYAFFSPDRPNSVTLIANYIPFEAPDGGPNYYRFGDNVLYEIKVDNIGDGKSHLTYQFQFKTVTNNPNTFLYNTGPINSLNDPNWNVRHYFTMTEIYSPLFGSVVTNVLFSNKVVPPINIGGKSTPNYAPLWEAGIYSTSTSDGEIKVFAGPADDPFWVDLGAIFDLLSLRPQAPPIGYAVPTAGVDSVAGYNIHALALQLPITRALKGAYENTTIGVWTTASRRTTTTLSPLGGMTNSGEWVQISRLGMPLTNEAVLPLALKDVFNGLRPDQDLATYLATPLLQQSVLTPELQTLLGALYGVPNPGKPRGDIFDIFLQGMVTANPFTITTPGGPVMLPPGTFVNRPISNGRQPNEVLRLNTGLRGLCAPLPNYALGVLGGDACGFPNGRRLEDDIVEIELLAVAGAAWPVLTSDTSFSMSPALVGVLNDGIASNDKPFRYTFPYLALPHAGQNYRHASLTTVRLPIAFRK